jgi:hypothetical protein
MDAGDADVELVVGALDDGERVFAVVVVASLCVRKASTRASGRARADEATTEDAGDADEELVVVALDDLERVLVVASLRVCEASTRASGRARADEATTDGDHGMDAGDADDEEVGGALDDGERVVAVFALRVCEASTRASGRARADEATTDGDPGMDAGDADEEVVVVALDDDRVLAVASLRAREASTRASARARGRCDDGCGSRYGRGRR